MLGVVGVSRPRVRTVSAAEPVAAWLLIEPCCTRAPYRAGILDGGVVLAHLLRSHRCARFTISTCPASVAPSLQSPISAISPLSYLTLSVAHICSISFLSAAPLSAISLFSLRSCPPSLHPSLPSPLFTLSPISSLLSSILSLSSLPPSLSAL